jgi:hypothetical protein
MPKSSGAGVPMSAPVALLKVAQSGFPTIVKVRVSPSGSLTAGVKAYCESCIAEAGGLPLIVGA